MAPNKKVEQDDLSSIGEHVQTSTIIEDNSSNSHSELLMDEQTSTEDNSTLLDKLGKACEPTSSENNISNNN